jgi:hypothetical protein
MVSEQYTNVFAPATGGASDRPFNVIKRRSTDPWRTATSVELPPARRIIGLNTVRSRGRESNDYDLGTAARPINSLISPRLILF